VLKTLVINNKRHKNVYMVWYIVVLCCGGDICHVEVIKK